MNNKSIKKQRGFTLVEMMVSVAIFTVIMTVGIGSLLSVLDKYRYAQETKEVSDSLNFVLEGLTREIRLGYNYCSRNTLFPQSTGCDDSILFTYNNGTSKTDLIGFEASDNRGYIVYGVDNGVLYRRIYEKLASGGYATEANQESLTDGKSVLVTRVRFHVMNAEEIEDQTQPLVWFQIVAEPQGQRDSSRSYTIQSLVSQRVLDA